MGPMTSLGLLYLSMVAGVTADDTKAIYTLHKGRTSKLASSSWQDHKVQEAAEDHKSATGSAPAGNNFECPLKYDGLEKADVEKYFDKDKSDDIDAEECNNLMTVFIYFNREGVDKTLTTDEWKEMKKMIEIFDSVDDDANLLDVHELTYLLVALKYFDHDHNIALSAPEIKHFDDVFAYFDLPKVGGDVVEADVNMQKEEWLRMEEVLEIFDKGLKDLYDGDGTIQLAEYTALEAALKVMDGNSNGKLEPLELTALKAAKDPSPCNVEDKIIDYEEGVKRKAVERYFDFNKDGKLSVEECQGLEQIFIYFDEKTHNKELSKQEWKSMEEGIQMFDDGNGSLDVEEFTRLMAALQKADKNKDGYFSDGEFEALKAGFMCPMQFETGIKDAVIQYFDKDRDNKLDVRECFNLRKVTSYFDANHDLSISKVEWARMYTMIEIFDSEDNEIFLAGDRDDFLDPQELDDLMTALEYFDHDADRVFEPSEYGNFRKVMNYFDVNSDNDLSHVEWMRMEYVIQIFDDGDGRLDHEEHENLMGGLRYFDSDGNRDFDPFEYQALRKVMSFFDGPAPGDGKLSKMEWGSMETVLQVFDDGDGILETSNDEFDNVLAALKEHDTTGPEDTPDDFLSEDEVQALIKKYHKTDCIAYDGVEYKDVQSYFDINGDTKLDIQECHNLKKVFHFFDDGEKNSDDPPRLELTKAEWTPMRDVMEMFDSVDDADNFLDSNELKHLLTALKYFDQNNDDRLQSQEVGNLKTVAKYFDTNGNTKLEFAECERMEQVIGIFDGDWNGFLDSEELQHLMDVLKYFDQNKDSRLDAAEVNILLFVFNYLDTSQDGKVQTEEWGEIQKVLDMFDNDGNGTLEPQEMKQLQFALIAIDDNGDGFLDKDELAKINNNGALAFQGPGSPLPGLVNVYGEQAKVNVEIHTGN